MTKDALKTHLAKRPEKEALVQRMPSRLSQEVGPKKLTLSIR